MRQILIEFLEFCFPFLETLDAFVGRYLTQSLLIMQLFSGEVTSQVRDVVT